MNRGDGYSIASRRYLYTSEKSESYNTIERGGLYDEIFTRRIYRHI